MLIKSTGDHARRLTLLDALASSPRLNAWQRNWAIDQARNLRTGLAGERSAAHYLNHLFKDDPNVAVIHDLRLVFDDEVAQIDHLLIMRGFVFYLLETKCFSGDLSINAHGEFTVHYGPRHYGIASPIEQSRRHERILLKWLERLGIAGRIGRAPEVVHVVLIDPKGTIQRPPERTFDSGCVIKADQFQAWRQARIDKLGLLPTLAAAINYRHAETVREWAEMLVRQHRPQDPLELPEFMRPAQATPAAPLKPVAHATAQGTTTPAVPHGRPLDGRSAVIQPASTDGGVVPPHANAPTPASGIPCHEAAAARCAICDVTLSARVAAFCRDNPQRFGGRLLCMPHQRIPGAAPALPPAASPRDAMATPRAVQATRLAMTSPQVAHGVGATAADARRVHPDSPVPASRPHDTPAAALRKRLVCATCGAAITFAEGQFCWRNERRFGGLQYCRDHQSNHV